MRDATLQQSTQNVCAKSILGNFQISENQPCTKHSSFEAVPALSGSLGYDLQRLLPSQIFLTKIFD